MPTPEFRAWDKKRNGLHYNVELYDLTQPVFDDGEELSFPDFILDPERFILQQCIHKYDTNDFRMFEGDLVQRDGLSVVVQWISAGFMFVAENGETMDIPKELSLKRWKVVGHIYDGTELAERFNRYK